MVLSRIQSKKKSGLAFIGKMCRLSVAATVVLLSLHVSVKAQAQGKVIKTYIEQGIVWQLRQYNTGAQVKTAWRPENYNWTEAPWRGDDREAKRILAAAGNTPPALLLKAVDSAREQLTEKSSPADRFRYACLVLAASDHYVFSGIKAHNEICNAVAMLAVQPQLSTPTVHRVRLLLESMGFPGPSLLPIAARLVQRDPDDYEMQLRYAKALGRSRRAEDCEKAVKYLEALRIKYPGKVKTLTYLGAALWYLSDLNHSTETMRRSISVYDEYIQKVPATTPFRAQAIEVRNIIKQELAAKEKH